MPTCLSCSANYDDTFKFCPYCGKAKPEPEVLNVNIHHSPIKYEEAVLKIELVKEEEITESPFDWRPSLIEKVLSSLKDDWTRISYFQLVLVSIHPQKGEYIAFKSDLFRAFLKDVNFPIPIRNALTYQPIGQKWIERLFIERANVWKQVNLFLINENWIGLTEKAIERTPPFELQMPVGWSTKKQTFWLGDSGFLILRGHSSIEQINGKYRYQHPIT